MTKHEFLEKVEWEGGIEDALAYGLSSEDCDDPEVADLWRKLEAFQPIMNRFNQLMADMWSEGSPGGDKEK